MMDDTAPAPPPRKTVWTGRVKRRTVIMDRIWLYLGGVWLACGLLLGFSDRDVPMFFFMLAAAFMPVLAGIHLIMRMGTLLDWLAAPELRQELALTMIQPRDFILARVRPRLFNLSLPFIALGPACLIGMTLSSRGGMNADLYAWVAIVGLYWVLAMLIGLLATADTFVRICRRPGTSRRRLGIQSLWALFLLSGPLVQFPASAAFLGSYQYAHLVRLLAVIILWGGAGGVLWRGAALLFDRNGRNGLTLPGGAGRVSVLSLRLVALTACGLFVLLPLSLAVFHADHWQAGRFILVFVLMAFWTAYAAGTCRLIQHRVRQAFEGYFVFEHPAKDQPGLLGFRSDSKLKETTS